MTAPSEGPIAGAETLQGSFIFGAGRLRGLSRGRLALTSFRGPDHQAGDGLAGLGA